MTKYVAVYNYGVEGPNYDGYRINTTARTLDGIRKELLARYNEGLKKWKPVFIDVYSISASGSKRRVGTLHSYGHGNPVSWITKDEEVYSVNPKTGKLARRSD